MTLRGVLFVDDAVPCAALGAGHPRGLAVLRELTALADRVAIVATQGEAAAELAAEPLPANVAVLDGPPDAALQRALCGEPRAFDVLWVGRPHNLALVERFARIVPGALTGMRVIYDAEAVFALRDARRRALAGTPMSESRIRHLLRQEFHPAHIASAIAAVSEAERSVIADLVPQPVHVLAYPAAPAATQIHPRGRAGALFVGNLARPDEPNGESMRWLLREVRPLVADVPVVIAGRGAEPDGWLASLCEPGVRLIGAVPDLRPRYAAARMFVAPTRYAAGIPLKVIEAAQHGVPAVVSPLVADLIGWRDGVELLVGTDAQSFANAMRRLAADDALWRAIAEGARAALLRDFSQQRFGQVVRELAGT